MRRKIRKINCFYKNRRIHAEYKNSKFDRNFDTKFIGFVTCFFTLFEYGFFLGFKFLISYSSLIFDFK